MCVTEEFGPDVSGKQLTGITHTHTHTHKFRATKFTRANTHRDAYYALCNSSVITESFSMLF